MVPSARSEGLSSGLWAAPARGQRLAEPPRSASGLRCLGAGGSAETGAGWHGWGWGRLTRGAHPVEGQALFRSRQKAPACLAGAYLGTMGPREQISTPGLLQSEDCYPSP